MDEREVLAALEEAIADGSIEVVGKDANGDPLIHLTAKGIEEVRRLARERGIDIETEQGRAAMLALALGDGSS